MFKEIDINDIKKFDDSIELIDIRRHDEVDFGMLPNAIHIEMMSLLINPSHYLDKDKVYYIYCAAGIRSANACLVLSEAGYRVVNLLGGIYNYNY